MSDELRKAMGGQWVQDHPGPGGRLHFIPDPPIRRNSLTLYEGMTVIELRQQLAGMPDNATLGEPRRDSTPLFKITLAKKKRSVL